MAMKVDDRVYETSTTTGTGTYTLDGAVTGFQAFSVLGAGALVPYFATDDTNWEVGLGTVATGPNTLARTVVVSSSNGDAAVNWGSGTKKIRCGNPAMFSPRKAIESRSSNTILGHGDFGKVINITSGTFSQTLTAAATLADGWRCKFVNSGSGVVTLDPNASETINGATTLALATGQGGEIWCDGAAFTMIVATNKEPDTVGVGVPVTGGIGKNAIVGGDFSTNPWQRGTSFATIAATNYSADRWRYNKNLTGAVHTISKSADAPTVAQAGRLGTHCLLVDCTTADAAVAAADLVVLEHFIEGYNVLPLAQRVVTLSFWHRHTKTGIYSVSIGNDVDRVCVKEYTQAVTDTWERSTVTFPALPSAGTWSYTNGRGLVLTFVLMAGTDYYTTVDAWQSNSRPASANQVNACDNVANNFRLALVQLEAGSVATEFEARSYQQELALCQRYYFKTFEDATAPAQGIGANTGEYQWAATVAGANAQNSAASLRFPTRMRAVPTVTTYSIADASANVRDLTAGAMCTAVGVAGISQSEVGRITYTGVAGTTVGGVHGVHVTASAEL